MVQIRQKGQTLGIILAIAAAVTYGTNPLFAKPMYDLGMSVESVLFYRYALSTVMFGLLFLAKRGSFRLKRQEVWPIAAIGILMGTASYTLYLSYTLMDSGIASTILFVYPVFVAIMMAVFYKERLNHVTKFCIVAAIVGVGVLCVSPGGGWVSGLGLLYVVVCSLFTAGFMVLIQSRALADTDSLKISFYGFCVATLGYIALAACCGLDLPSASMTSQYAARFGISPLALCCLCAVLIAYIPTVFSFDMTAKAVQKIGPTPTSIFGALEPVTAVVFGILLFDEALTAQKIIGIVIVIAAVVLLATRNRRNDDV